MKDLDALAKAAAVEGIGFHQFEDRLLRLGLDYPETSLGKFGRFVPERTGDEDRVFMFLDPCNVSRQMLRTQGTVCWLVNEDGRRTA